MYMVHTIAGSGRKDYGDAIGKEAKFNDPFGIIITRDGESLIVADLGNRCIRKVSILNGTTSTITGNPGMVQIDLSASSSSETLFIIGLSSY